MEYSSVRPIWYRAFAPLLILVSKHKITSVILVLTYVLLNFILPQFVSPVSADYDNNISTISAASLEEKLPVKNVSVTGATSNNNTPAAASVSSEQCQKASPIKPEALNLTSPGLNEKVQPPQYYRVYGNTVEQIKAQLKKCAPESHFAQTNYFMNWSYTTKPNADGNCFVDQSRVGINIVYQYPSWQNSGKASKVTEDAWNRMLTSLVVHEQGHASKSTQVARELSIALANAPAQNCDQLDAYIKNTTAHFSQKLTDINAGYDHETGHGKTEGATL